MGHRTVVILFNDEQQKWQHDPELGQKIATSQYNYGEFYGGKVVEVAHSDDQSLAVIDSYNYQIIGDSNWIFGETPDEVKLKLLRRAAEAMGYSLVKKV